MLPLNALSDQVGIRFKYSVFWKLFIFNCGFSTYVTSAFLLQENEYESLEFNTYASDNIFHIIDQIKISRVSLWIGDYKLHFL